MLSFCNCTPTMNALDFLVDFVASVSVSQEFKANDYEQDSLRDQTRSRVRTSSNGYPNRASAGGHDTTAPRQREIGQTTTTSTNLTVDALPSSCQEENCLNLFRPTNANAPQFDESSASSIMLQGLGVPEALTPCHQGSQYLPTDLAKPKYCRGRNTSSYRFDHSVPIQTQECWIPVPQYLPDPPPALDRSALPEFDCICGDASCQQRYFTSNGQPMIEGYVPALKTRQTEDEASFNKQFLEPYWAQAASQPAPYNNNRTHSMYR